MKYLIIGLALGAAACLLIVHILNNRKRWEFFKNKKRRGIRE